MKRIRARRATRKAGRVAVRARRYLEGVLKDYADVMLDEEGETLGELSKDELAGLEQRWPVGSRQCRAGHRGKDVDGKR